ncbi:MAG: hypothetical protein HY811_02015 [Planctomycetes bacterium]|nr:hypothetical protein [Planctomycetota bacterium]
MNNILYVFDDGAKIEKFLSQNLQDEKIHLCPITSDEIMIENTVKTIREKVKSEVVRVPFVQIFHEKAFAIKDEYVKFIADVGDIKIAKNKTLKKYFKYPGKDFSVWWFSLIAEKNTAKTNSYHKLVKLVTILDIQVKYQIDILVLDLKDKELSLAVKDNEKNNGFIFKDLNDYSGATETFFVIKSVFRAVQYALQMVKWVALIKTTGLRLSGRKKTLRNISYFLVTYFPLVDKNKIKEGLFIDKYYQPLQFALEEKYSGKFAWQGLSILGDDFTLKESFILAKKINETGNTLFLCEEWLTPGDFFRLAMAYMFYLGMFFSAKSSVQKKFKFTDKHYKIWRLFEKDWCDSFCGQVLIEGVKYYLIFGKTFAGLDKKTAVIYIAENHAWEKALNIAANEYGITTIGIQHTTVSLLHLMYFNYGKELEYKDNIVTMPKPKYLACAGNIPADIFHRMGWKNDSAFSWGAMRTQYLRQYISDEIFWKDRKNKIVIALSIMPKESKGLLRFVAQAFRDKPNYQVVIKKHPFLHLDKIEKYLKNSFFKIVATSLSELLPTAKALVVNESSASIESIACQCPVIIPRLTDVVDMNPLSGVSNLPVYVDSPERLKKVVDAIVNSKTAPITYQQCRDFVCNYYGFFDSDNEFLQRLEKKVE